jgi:excisionase family DNA binding protein
MVNVAMIPLREAAERLGVHENTVRNWIDRGVIVGVRLPTGTRRLPVAEVERLEREMFAMPTSFASEVVVPAPKPVPREVPPGAYPDL